MEFDNYLSRNYYPGWDYSLSSFKMYGHERWPCLLRHKLIYISAADKSDEIGGYFWLVFTRKITCPVTLPSLIMIKIFDIVSTHFVFHFEIFIIEMEESLQIGLIYFLARASQTTFQLRICSTSTCFSLW